MTESATLYDAVAYPGHAYDYTYPGRLATVAALFGMQPARLSRCRVLELGCGNGDNLIPAAYQWTDSEFVGIDLSGSAIAQGQAAVAAVGLNNLTLRHCDIMDVDRGFGQFDYIIAHGVYSWVPAPVREKILAILGELLTPQGVAYLSYNSQPGSHLRDLSREIMHHHVRSFEDPRERIAQGRAILKVMAELSGSDEVYGLVLRGEFERVSKMSDEVLFHDDLSSQNDAFLLTEVVAAAERHGLQYLSDATFYRADLQRSSDKVRRLLQQFPDDAVVEREQYQDFIEGHSFRRSLFCRSGIKLQRKLSPEFLQRFYLSAEAVPEGEAVDPAAAGVASFTMEKIGRLSTDHRLTKAAVLHLGRIWPAAITFKESVEAALALLGEAEPVRANLDDELEALRNALFRASCAGHITLNLFPPKLTTRIGERPRASLVARKQSETGALITNLDHGTVFLEDEVVRRFLGLVDGTRTVDDLVADLSATLASEDPAESPADAAAVPASRPEVTRAMVEQKLGLMARLGLLEA